MPSPSLAEHLRRHASRYFTDLCSEPIHVELRRISRRTNSILQEFVIGSSKIKHTVLVKQPTAPVQPTSSTATDSDRPRLFPKVLPELKSRFEFVAMAAIERHMGRADDQRFAAVRVLELLPGQQGLVMERARERNLAHLLLRGFPLPTARIARERIDRIVYNCGSWLRRYHGLPELEHTRTRGKSRGEFTKAVSRFTDYLGRSNGNADFMRLGREMVFAAEATLPRLLPLGLAHGDYAPRNVLAAPGGRIRVIDTLGRWKAPIYEDISHFLVAIKASTTQIMSRGLACRPRRVEQLERQFLSGYFETQCIPLDHIRLFECQALIERWAANTYRARDARNWKRLAKKGRVMWSDAFMRNLVDRLLDDVPRTPASPSIQGAV